MNVAVVGAGAVGLSTAWHLNRLGAQVTVFDMKEPGNGASWGNAGQILPSKAVPLSDPGNLKFALKSFFKRNSPVTAPRNFDSQLIKFLIHFATNSTKSKHSGGSSSMWRLSKDAVEAYAELEASGVATTRKSGPFSSAFKIKSGAHSFFEELSEAKEAFPGLAIDLLAKEELLELEPLLDDRYNCGVVLHNQHYIHPPLFIKNLHDNLRTAGVEFIENSKIVSALSNNSSVVLETESGKKSTYNAVVIATGAWLNRLVREHGVSHPVVAGIGYSLSVEVPHQTQGMLYLPEARLATTNFDTKLRISTFMQMTDVETPFDINRMNRLIQLAKSELPKAYWGSVGDYWSGGRPLSGDGKPLLGATKSRGIYVNSGHGMWGITLAPISGKLLAESIITGRPISKDFDPLR